MKKTRTIDDIVQMMRSLKLSQIRKQLEDDQKPGYIDYPDSTMVSRARIVEDFFDAASRQKP
jgi:hypothetical protein